MVPLTAVLIFILSVFAAAILAVEDYIREQDIAERTASVEMLFKQKLAKDTNLMTAAMRAMMTNKAIERAFEATNRGVLAKHVGPLFDGLRESSRITHLYFTRPDLVNLYRFHSPAKFGDEIKLVEFCRRNLVKPCERRMQLDHLLDNS